VFDSSLFISVIGHLLKTIKIQKIVIFIRELHLNL
jgi:hypothetical protein